jgi:hypothetical protein
MSGADWIPLVIFGLFAFFGVLLPRLAKRQAKWQRNLPPRDDAGTDRRYEEPGADLEEGYDYDGPEDALQDERPPVRIPQPRPVAPLPLPRPVVPAPRPARQPSPAVLAARAEARTPQAPRPSRPGLIRDRADARRGITLMAVLGPCRAVDPY